MKDLFLKRIVWITKKGGKSIDKPQKPNYEFKEGVRFKSLVFKILLLVSYTWHSRGFN